MSLDFSLREMRMTDIFDVNVTHNLTRMASEAGLYEVMWRSQDHYRTAAEMIPALRSGLVELRSDPERFKKFNPPNWWGSYEALVEAAEKILRACEESPSAKPYSCV